MVIAVDFDGTIVEHAYPRIGKEIPFAIATLKRLRAERHLLILWTVREGKLLEEAVEFCRRRGLEFYAVNRNYPEESDEAIVRCRKINADFFIDDLNVGGLPDWGLIYEMITRGTSFKELSREATDRENKTREGFLYRLFKKVIHKRT